MIIYFANSLVDSIQYYIEAETGKKFRSLLAVKRHLSEAGHEYAVSVLWNYSNWFHVGKKNLAVFFYETTVTFFLSRRVFISW